MRNKAVIGANFGDEGKGLMTDYFASELGRCIVVRFNGGAQAGHTVVTPDGRRHKFSHFGSGSLWGAPTYLSKFFIANPILFMKELDEFNFLPQVYVDEECLISTPYDMYLNQVAEKARGEGRYGSCGMGINETINRSSEEQFCLRAVELKDTSLAWGEKFKRIAEDYFPRRLEELGQKIIEFDQNKFLEEFEWFITMVKICDSSILAGENIVFEGAQGLLLDQNHEYFPHVTRSNTGFENAREILHGIDRLNDETEVTYVTRTYLTRHGRGPFPTEISGLPYEDVVDDTNVFNDYQEDLRFGFLDFDSLVTTIRRDAVKNHVQPSVAITCVDQIGHGTVKCYQGGVLINKPLNSFVEELKWELGARSVYVSLGKTRNTIIQQQ